MSYTYPPYSGYTLPAAGGATVDVPVVVGVVISRTEVIFPAVSVGVQLVVSNGVVV
jgi:hypothetical protein